MMEVIIADCVIYIEIHLNSYWSLTELAERYHYSPFHFSHFFKEVTGFTLAAYICNADYVRPVTRFIKGLPSNKQPSITGFKVTQAFIEPLLKSTVVAQKTT